MNTKTKQADVLQLRVLKRTIQSGTPIAKTMRASYVLVLARVIADQYPARAKSRPRKDERNLWIAVDYLLRCKAKRATKTAESTELSDICSDHEIAISPEAIRKLPAQYTRAKRLAARLLKESAGRRDPLETAINQAFGHWLRAEVLSRTG